MSFDQPSDRRKAAGVALLTLRRQTLIPRCLAAGIAFHHVVLQEGPQLLPKMRPPLLLDTVGLEPPVLIALLVELQRQAASQHSEQATQPQPKETITMVLVEPDNIRFLRLLSLCAVVRIIASDSVDMLNLAPFTRHLNGIWLPPGPVTSWSKPALVGLDPLPDLKPSLPPLLLPVLAALLSAPNTNAAARASDMSRAKLMRVLAKTRTALKLPAGEVSRYRPAQLAAAILDALNG